MTIYVFRYFTKIAFDMIKYKNTNICTFLCMTVHKKYHVLLEIIAALLFWPYLLKLISFDFFLLCQKSLEQHLYKGLL